MLIRVWFAGVNPLDSNLLGRPTAASSYPFVVGIDFAGVAEAAALPIPAVTALRTVELLEATAGQHVVVMGATGGVGGYAVQMVRSCGAHVIATVRGDAGGGSPSGRRGVRQPGRGRDRCAARRSPRWPGSGLHIRKCPRFDAIADLDIAEYTDPEHNPMIPHTLVFKPGLVIHSVYNGYWFWGRPSFYDLWRDLRAATAEIRPDWDLSTPGLREAWDTGDYSKFHGWDRRFPGSTPTSYE